MPSGFFAKVDRYDPSSWKAITNFFVKKTSTTWTTINDAWVKVSPTTWKKFWTSATNPDSPIEILTSFTSGELLRLQGVNYHWTPSPSTLFYKFTYVDGDNVASSIDLVSSTSTSNPASGTSTTLPTSTTYRTISKTASPAEFTIGGVSSYKFYVTGTTSSGAVSQQVAEYQMRTPLAPNVSVELLSGTSLTLTITPASTADGTATGRYIVYTSDSVDGLVESGGGRGGYAYAATQTVTLTGLTAGRAYDIYVAPFTGTSGTTTANASGYPGAEKMVTATPVAEYTFTFGKTLYVGTNGYIGLESGSSSDQISSTSGKVLGILPGDLNQDSATSIWYWSDTSRFIIRWEGFHYNQPANIRQYEVVFYKDANYATVYAINVANTTEGTEAYVKNGIALTSYSAALGTGSLRTVYFDANVAPVIQYGPYVTKSKSVMKQVTGLTSGSVDIGYTAITTSTDQNQTPTIGTFDVSSFVKNLVYSSAQGASRSTDLSWGAASGATAYQVQYQGSNDNTNWTTVQAYSSTNNITGTTDTKTWSTSGGNFSYYTFMRANVRALESTGLATYVYSNNGSYVEASGIAPGQPSFGTISAGSAVASIPFTVGTQGTNYLYSSIEYMYRSSAGAYGTTWSTSVINNGAGTISLSGLSTNTTYYIKIRTRNYDELYSQENETNFTTASSPIQSVTYDGAGTVTVNANIGGPNWQIYWNTISSQPSGTYYDAVSTTNVITDTLTPSTTSSYWFWVRSSTANLGTSKTSGNAAAGTYGTYEGPYIIRHITYNFNGGSDTNYSTFIADGSSVSLPTPTARTGYTFAGWWDATSGGNNLGSGTSSYTVQSTLTVYARWTPDTYTISYDANGGTGAPSDQTKTYGTTLTLSSTTPTRTNYAFRGWNTNSSGTGTDYSSGGSYTTNAAATLYAKWGSLYTISFDSQSGTSVSAIQQSSYGGSIAKPTDPTRTDYTFGGWATSSTGTTAVTWPRTPTADETLYAIWTAATTLYTVTFNANGATGSPSVSSVTQTTANGSVTLATKGTLGGGTNRIFGGWRTAASSGTVYAFGATYTPTGNVTLYAYYGTQPSITTPGWGASNFQRDNANKIIDWYTDYPAISGAGTIVGMEYAIRTTAGGGTLLASGTKTYDGTNYKYSAGGTFWGFAMGTTDGDITHSTSARYGRVRIKLRGIDGLDYFSGYTAWY